MQIGNKLRALYIIIFISVGLISLTLVLNLANVSAQIRVSDKYTISETDRLNSWIEYKNPNPKRELDHISYLYSNRDKTKVLEFSILQEVDNDLRIALVKEFSRIDQENGKYRVAGGMRTAGDWATLNIIIVKDPQPREEIPDSINVIAHRDKSGWKVGISGSKDYVDLIGQAPSSFLETEAKNLLKKQYVK